MKSHKSLSHFFFVNKTLGILLVLVLVIAGFIGYATMVKEA